MIKRANSFSIKAKLNLILAVVAASAVLLACVAFGYNDITDIRSTTVQHLTAVGDVVGANTVAALTFDDSDAANEVLASLRLEPSVRFACVYRDGGQVFSQFQSQSNTTASTPPEIGQDGHVFTDQGTLELFSPIFDEGERIGTLYLQAGLDHVQAKLTQHLIMAVIVGFVSLGTAMLLASRLLNLVTVPIKQLAETTDRISKERSFSVRVEKMYDDEIGSLYDAFNRMLVEIEASQKELQDAHDQLESRVQKRTRELSETNRDLNHEIAVRTQAEEELQELQARHLDTARRMGMAEIATSVLHNVGNVLNSVNVSTTVIGNKLRKCGASDLVRAADLVQKHRLNLTAFVSQDERGRHLPDFLVEQSRHMASQEESLLKEVESLATNIGHIKDIIAVQQSNAGLSGLVEKVSLAELFEDAIRINSASMGRHGINIIRQLDEMPPVLIEKQKVMQILVNLIANAKYAVIENDLDEKHITVSIAQVDDQVRIQVIDNGVGIPGENLARIFSHGFTTRKGGHGFGLHSGSLAAKEMGGELTAHSDGPGTGATFTLDIPVKQAEVKECPIETT